MKTLTQAVFDNILNDYSATNIIDSVTATNLQYMLEILEEQQIEALSADFDTGVDTEENALDIAAFKRVISFWVQEKKYD